MTTTLSTAEGWFKERYGQAADAIPQYAVCRERIQFKNSERIGDSYHFPIRVQRSHGWTLQGGSTVGDAFALNSVKSGQMKDASLGGSAFVMRESFGYATLSRATDSEVAFGDIFDESVEDMTNTANAVMEIEHLYGQTNLGAVTANGSSATTVAYSLTTASSSLGMMAQLEGAYVDVYDVTRTTQRNTNGPLEITLVDWDETNQRVTLSLTGAAADNNAVVAADVLVLRGAGTAASPHDFAGIDKIATNASSLFGIDAATYKVWKANEVTVGSVALNFQRLTRAGIGIAARSGESMATAMVSLPTWADLNNDSAALRRLSASEGKLSFGAKGMTFYGVSGEIEIVPHPFLKHSEAFIVDFDQFRRVGSTDLTFETPEAALHGETRYVIPLANNAGVEVRCWWDQALVCRRPRSMTKLSGIVNSTS